MTPHRFHDRNEFYKYTTANTAKIVLQTGKLRWSNPKLFNDPFDVPSRIFGDVDTTKVGLAIASVMRGLIEGEELPHSEHLRTEIKFLLNAYKRAEPQLKKELLQECENYAQIQPESNEGLEMMQNNWESEYLNQRIVCFTERWNSASMWDRYSDRHKGVVIEFKCLDSVDSASLCARPINYTDEPLKCNSAQGLAELFFYEPKFSIKRFLHEYTHTKTTDWAYEREWRLASFKRFGEEGDFSDYGFFPQELGGITFGTDISDEDRDELISIVERGEYDDVIFWQAEHTNGRHLDRTEIIRP